MFGIDLRPIPRAFVSNDCLLRHNKGSLLLATLPLIVDFETGVDEMLAQHQDDESMQGFTAPLQQALARLVSTTDWVKGAAKSNFNEVGAASYGYLQFLALILYAYMWAKMARAALTGSVSGDADFYNAKLETARFFYARLLPRYKSIAEEIESGSETLMALSVEQF